ncbi:phage protein Gp27 family protein [Stenotrophomonas sp. PS02298]|uniref:phage protein Gp27 family protein n=1 Tax=Stenotrophomonas sp. PS02298 TaxID=2991424 RepID=UPI00249C330E|nr:phage protein Gp27 family protein [Stenotrophomonas sp. PS02298]
MAAPKRRAKSTVTRLPAEQKAYVEKLLRDDRMTLDEKISDLQANFPGEPAAEISRSALHRYEQGFAEMTARMRDIDRASQALVGEFGDSLGEKASTLLTNAVVTLVTDVAMRHQASEKEVDVDTARKLARAAKDAIDTKRIDVNVRKAIAAEARERLLRDQEKALDKVVKSGGLSAEAAADIRASILGIRTDSA